MASLNQGEVRRQLSHKFHFELTEGDHHFYALVIDNKIVRQTKVSHNKKTIGDTLIGKMAKQLGVRNGQFCEMINCTLSEADYLRILGFGSNPTTQTSLSPQRSLENRDCNDI